MTDSEDGLIIKQELRPHHRLFLAILILSLLFVPVVLAAVFSRDINETNKAPRPFSKIKHQTISAISNEQANVEELQSTGAIINPVINLDSILSKYNSQDKSFGVSLVELGGKNRTGAYNGDSIFVSASTYKLFTAYSALLRVEDGSWHWSDDISDGRNLAACFNDMIVFSDNNCAEAISEKIGYYIVTDEAKSIGCLGSTLVDVDGYAKTTANDLALFLEKLYKGQILSQQSSRDLLTNAMKNNIYREGIPAGVSNSTVADKVGFIDGYLNDAAIVYDAKGDFVLVIMTNNSSWSEIANLAADINSLR